MKTLLIAATALTAMAAAPAFARDGGTHISFGFYSPAPAYYSAPVVYYPPVHHVYYAPPRYYGWGYGYRRHHHWRGHGHGHDYAWNDRDNHRGHGGHRGRH